MTRMFLSNPHKFFLLAFFFTLILQACGSSAGNENRPFSLNVEKKKQFPFSTKEPEVYQGDFVMSDGPNVEHVFVARNGAKWRSDFFQKEEVARSQIMNDRLYSVDHVKKTFYAEPVNQAANDSTGDFNTASYGFFRGRDYREFEEIGRDNGLIKYKIRVIKGSPEEIVVTLDEATGIIVREEFTSQKGQTEEGSQMTFIYEVRNLKTEVDDSVFQIPAGYREVSREEFWPTLIRK